MRMTLDGQTAMALQVRRTYRTLSAIDGIGGNKVLVIAYFKYDVCLGCLYVFESFLISCLLTIKDKVVRDLYLMNELL